MAISAVAGLAAGIGAAAAAGGLAALTFFSLSGFAAFAGYFAVGAGLSMISRALAPKPNIGAQMRGITQTTREPASSRKIIYGRMRVGGQVVFLSHSGDDNKYLHLAIAFASHEIQAYDEIWFNDNRIWTASNGFQGDWGTYVTIDRKFGTAGQSASTDLVNANSRWTTDHKLSGIAYIAFRLEWDQDKFPQGVPNITATIRGKKVYDPRTQTIAYSQNPALCVRDYMISEYGLDEDAATINDTSVSDAADLCDESVSLDGGGTQDRYQCNGVIDTANQIKANIEQLLSSMGGRLTYSGGEYFIDGAEYKTPSHTFTEADVISDIQTQTKQSRRGIYNGVKGIFVSEEKNYKVLDYPAQISSTYEAEDGDPIYLDMPLPCVTNNTQAQRLAKIALLKSRQQVVMTLTVNLKGLNVKVGDTIQVTNDRLNYSSKVFEVIDYSLAITDGALGVNLSCIETGSAIYDWTTSDEADFLSGGELPLYDGRTVDNVTSLTMTEIGLRGPDGGVKSAVELSWTAPTDAFIEFYTVRYNKNGTTDYFEVQTRETNVLLEGLDVTSNYDFQVKAQNLIGVRSSGTSLTNQSLNGDTTAPSAPTSGAATGGIQTITAEWSNPTDIDFKHVEVFVNTTDSIPATPTAVVDGEEYIVTGLSGASTRYFWLKSVDFSGNKSAATASFSGTSVVASSSDIGTGAVGSGNIADGAVGTNQIATGAITTTTIADDAITTPKIATNAVTANEIAANTITASQIASNTITASEIATDTITASEIAAGAIDTTELAADAVTTAKIAANAVTANEIAANTITASQIATDTITASEIAAGAIDTTELAADAVTTAKIAANAVTATEINVTSLDDISADAGTITGGSVGGISITSTKLYAGTGDWANTNTGFYVDNTGKFSLKDKFFYNPSNNLLTVDGNITADVITAKENLVVLGDLEASSMAAGSITRAMFSQDALDEIYGALATSVGGSNGDYKEASGSFTTSGGTVTVGTSSDKFDHGTADVVVEFLANHYFYTTTNYTTAQAQATLNFEVSADGTFTDLTSATKTQTLQFGEYDLSSYYGYTYLVYFFNGEHSKTFTTGSGNDIPDSTELQFRVRVTGVGTAFTSQTVPFTVEANEGVTGVVSTGGNADTLDNLDSTKFLRSDVDDTFDANLTITGNLTVNGTQTTLNTATLQVEDKNIVLNYGTGDTSGSADGAGITIQDAVNSSTDATILWNATTDKFDFSHGIDVTGATTLDGYVYVNVAGNNLVLQSDSVQRETIQWTQNNVNRWKLNLQADGDLDFVPADTADKLLYNSNEIFHDGYHPNADKWTTPRTLTVTLTGDVTGTANTSIDGSANKTITISTTGGGASTDTLDDVTDRGATTTNNITVGTITSGQITSSGSVTAGNASTSLGYYVGTTQVIQGSTRNLVNIGSIGSGSITSSGNIISSQGTPTGSVIGGIRAYGTSQAYMGASDGSGRTAFFGVDASGYAMFGALTNHDAVLRANNSEKLRIKTNGEINIASGGSLALNGTTVIDSNRQIYAKTGTQVGEDGTYAGYGVLGFGGIANGYNRVFGRDDNGDGLFLAAATGRKVFVRSNGGTAGDDLSLGQDDSYSGYSAIGFGSYVQNGYNRVFGHKGTGDGLYLTAATGHGMYFRVNGSSSNSFQIRSNGSLAVGANAGTVVLDQSRNLTNIGGGAYKANLGATSFSWGGSTSYPTLYGSHPDRWVMICMPHIPYMQNSVRGYTGSSLGSVIRMETSTDYSNYWDVGVLHNISAQDFAIANNQTSPKMRINPDGTAHFYRGAAWGETTQGTSKGTIHLDPENATDHFGGAITFGASDASSGNNAQAGIYIRSDGSYGTKMYLATTDSYATGSKTAMTIDHAGAVSITRSTLNVQNGLLIGGQAVISATRNITAADGGFSGLLSNSAGAKLEIQGGVNGGNARGIFMWETTDSNWGIYMAEAGSGRALSGGTAPSGLDGASSHHIRFRCYNQNNRGWIFENSSNQARASINANTGNFLAVGNVTAYASDQRLKENITPITDPIEKIKRLQGVEFDWKADCEDKGFIPSFSRETGVIAQNVAEVVPDAVSPAPFDNDYLTVDKSKLVAVLIEAVKAQQEQIDSLKDIIEEMKNGNHKDD